VEVILAEGVAIPVAAGSIDLAFSHQVLEHLHPDDAGEHARNVRRCLTPGGVYLCVTTNRLTGPHDISKHFGDTGQGFHLREYSLHDQYDLFVRAGFRDVRVAIALGGEVLALAPAQYYALLESISARAPLRLLRHRLLTKLLNPGAVVAYA
ncbi:MAG: class I SAM-dependent methyltransferase, partial [Solirubrobacteraceae bacterium]